MNIINPFDKRGKENLDFIDRSAIAVLFLLFALVTIYILVSIVSLLKKLTNYYHCSRNG